MVARTESMLSAALEALIQSLPKMSPEGGIRKFYVNKIADNPSIAFTIVEKLPAGQLTPEGSRIKNWGGLTYRQCNQIERTSESVAEVVQRFHAHVFEGIDTTRTERNQGGMDPLTQQREIEARVNSILAEKLDELIDKRLAARVADKTPTGIQRGAHTSKVGEKPPPGIDEEWEMWRERAAKAGFTPPIARTRDRRIDGRWLRVAGPLWAQHLDGVDVSGRVIAFGKPFSIGPVTASTEAVEDVK